MSTLITTVADSFRLTFRWLTDVLTADDGTERRICLAQLPDILLESSFTFDPSTASTLRALKTLLATSPLELYDIPFRFEAVGVSALGATTFDLPITNCADWAAVGRRILLEQPGVSPIACTIFSTANIGGGIFRIDVGASLAAFSQALIEVSPLFTVQPEDGQAIGWHRDHQAPAGAWVFKGRLTGYYTQGVGLSPPDVNGLMTHMLHPRTEAEVGGEEFRAGLEFVDFGLGFSVTTGHTYADALRDGTYNIQGLAEWRNLKAFLYACYGQQVAFLTPTWKPDISLYTAPVPPYDYIQIDRGLEPDLTASPAHRYVLVRWTDGTHDVMEIAGFDDNGDNWQVNFVGGMTGTGTVDLVCWVEKTRLSADDVVADVLSGCTLDVSFGLQTVSQ